MRECEGRRFGLCRSTCRCRHYTLEDGTLLTMIPSGVPGEWVIVVRHPLRASGMMEV